MGHIQLPTEIITDNYTTDGIMRGTTKQKRTKSMDMLLYCVPDQVKQKQFGVKWKPEHINLGDYFTKYYLPTHHQSMQQTYLINAIISLQERILKGRDKTSNLGAGEHGDWPQPN